MFTPSITSPISSSFAHSSAVPAITRNLQTVRPSVRSIASRLSLHTRAWVKATVKAVTDNSRSEEFYQNHVAAIYFGLYVEMAVAMMLAALGVRFFA